MTHPLGSLPSHPLRRIPAPHVVAAAIALLFLASPQFAHAAPGKVHHSARAIPGEYIVVLNSDLPAADVPRVARELAHSSGGRLRTVWTHAIKGFYIEMTNAQAIAMSHDSRVKYIDANERISLSYAQNTTMFPPTGATGSTNFEAHLDRIDQSSGVLNYQYNYCATGNNVYVYVIDGGVKRDHNEFNAAHIKDGYSAADGARQWIAGNLYPIGAEYVDSAGNSWICMTSTRIPTYNGGYSGSTYPFDPAQTSVPDGDLRWRNFGPVGKAYDPCNGWPVNTHHTFFNGPQNDADTDDQNYYQEVGMSGHGTSVASMVAGQTVGVAKNALIVPLKMIRCDEAQARSIVIGHPYVVGDRTMNGGAEWICTKAGTASRDFNGPGTAWIGPDYPAGTCVADDNTNCNTTAGLTWNNIGPARVDTDHSNEAARTTMAVDAMEWILNGNPNPVAHQIVSFSTAVVAGTQSYEDAVQSLIGAGMTVFASANNNNVDACGYAPADLSRGNPASVGHPMRKVITVGGSSNQNGSDSRWCPDCTHTVEGSGSNYGVCVDIFAPAANITSARMNGPSAYRTIADADFGPGSDAPSGTSFAAPIAAGVGAQFLELYPNGGPDEVYNALINSSVVNALDPATLQGSPNRLLRSTQVWIYSSPTQNHSVAYNTTATLTVQAVGWGPLTYQWYAGLPSDTSSPISGATGATLSPVVTGNAVYWCRVSTTTCDSTVASLDSPAYAVSVSCYPVGISTQPAASPATIVAGGNSTLSIGVTGTSPLVQWYTSSNTFVGSGTMLTVSPTSTTTYYATVSNSCSSSITSAPVTVTICVPATITAQPTRTPSMIAPGGSATLSIGVAGSSPISVLWYTTAGVAAGSGTTVSVSPTASTAYYAVVSNACQSPGVQSNNTPLVKVCSGAPPAVTAAPTVSPSTITAGQTATLQASGGSGAAPLTFTWYTSGGTSVGTGKKLVVQPAVTTTYYYTVANACGESDPSSTVTVTVH